MAPVFLLFDIRFEMEILREPLVEIKYVREWKGFTNEEFIFIVNTMIN